MSVPWEEQRLSFFQPELTSIAFGLVSMMSLIALSLVISGILEVLPLLFVSGFIGGGIAGWFVADTVMISSWSKIALIGTIHGAIAAGIGGSLIYVFLVTLSGGALIEQIVNAGRGGVYLLLIASPLSVLLYCVEGSIGGVFGSTLRVYIIRRLQSTR